MYSKVEIASSYIAARDLVRELGEAPGVDAAVLVEVIEAEPLAEELGREAARLGIGGHARDLCLSTAGSRQLPAAAARRSSSSGIDDQRKKLRRLAISQSSSGFSASRGAVSTR